MKKLAISLMLLAAFVNGANAEPSRIPFNNDWRFALGNAADMQADYTHGTEYFTYLTKVRSNNQNHGPANPAFDDSGWQKVNLPHDWVVDLPFSGEASHSHGYKCVGWRYPENSVGWYRKEFPVPAEDEGMRYLIEFEGIFRDSEVFCNGIYLGHERSGYASRVYDLTECLEFGKDNVVTVRCDASTEEGWFYEGAGIYRNVWLYRTGPAFLKPYSVSIVPSGNDDTYTVSATIDSPCSDTGKISWTAEVLGHAFSAHGNRIQFDFPVSDARRWSLEDPFLHTLHLTVQYGDGISDEKWLKFGIRDAVFDAEKGFLLNGQRVQIKGCDLHQDAAGVGSGIPDELWRYRLTELKKYGFNTIRSSHNPASPAFLDLCDELGFLVIDENRLMGPGEEQLGLLEDMIYRDRNHPSVILWSIGNEEWAVEWDPHGESIARRMVERAHRADPTRQVTYGGCSGPFPNYAVDVPGYNYVVQNPILDNHTRYPYKSGVGTEETSGCGTRGKYETDPDEGWMTPLNRSGVAPDGLNSCDEGWAHTTPDGQILNVIERGWRFYKENPWLGGLCYWTGTDYRGEPNPMVWPATGSQFGILDYCCYPKDEAFYLKSWWTEDPVLHICGPFNGEVWVYSNCPKVKLWADGKSLGAKAMPEDGHLWWRLPSEKTGKITAKGYCKDRQAITAVYPDIPTSTTLKPSKTALKADGQDIVVIDIDSPEEILAVSVEGAQFLGWGNGNPGFKEIERPLGGNRLDIKPFCGKAQVIVRSLEGVKGTVLFRAGSEVLELSAE